jgi:hypothetical protein
VIFHAIAGVAAGVSLAGLAAQDVHAQGVPAASLDGHYRGMLVCERLPRSPGPLRAPLDIIVSGTEARFARPMFTIDGSRVTGSEMASGTIGADGKVQFASRGENINAAYQGSYSGAISANGGTLSGTQTFSTPAGNRMRACYAAFVKTGG